MNSIETVLRADTCSKQMHYGIKAYFRSGVQRGWRVAMKRRNLPIDRFFLSSELGGVDVALQAAIAFRDQVNREFPPLTRQERCATLSVRNTSGVPGVVKSGDAGAKYWKAQIRFPDGHSECRQFSVRKYGEEGAFQLAVEARKAFLLQVEGHAACHPEMRAYVVECTGQDLAVVRQSFKVAPIENPFAQQHATSGSGVGRTHLKVISKDGALTRRSYWTAKTLKPNGLWKRRYFSVDRLGEDEAHRLAVEQVTAWKGENT